MNSLLISVILLFLAFLNSQAEETRWTFDKSHSEIKFAVSHMVISEVTGNFREFNANISTQSDNFENAKIEFTANINSINTQNEKRDNHLKSDDFFNAEKFPEMKFVSKSMKKVKDNKYKLTGDLTIRDVTKTVSLDVDLRGIINDSWGNTRAGFKIKGNIDRFDYGLKWNKALETGSLIAGRDVEIVCDIEIIKQK
jgi:polyisoprenoid-binding protein YceI